MSIQRKSNNIRLLESLDYVDIKYVDELVGGLHLPKESAAEPSAKRSFRASVKYAALIAACALLLGAAIPVAGTLIRNITSGTAAAGDEQNLPYLLEEDLQVKEQTEDAFDGTPLFAVMNTEDYHKQYTIPTLFSLLLCFVHSHLSLRLGLVSPTELPVMTWYSYL